MPSCKFLQDFKDFAIRGNVMDMAVGVIIGGAFGKIITSLVNDIIMPPIAWIIGDTKFTDLSFTLKEATTAENGTQTEAITLNYGNFLQTSIDFLIVAFCIFLMVRAIAKLSALHKREEEAQSQKPAEPSAEEKLLTEIRDLLKENKK